MAETSTAIVVIQYFDRRPCNVTNRLHDELCNSVTTVHLIIDRCIVIDHDDL